MMIRALLLTATLMATPAAAQVARTNPPAPPAATAPPPPQRSILQHVRLMTSAGEIILALDTSRAPRTAANFLAYVDQRRLDGTVFYRTMRMGDGGLIQGGTRGDRARVLRAVPHEPTSMTGLSHTNMAISMARGAPGTADGDFFIIVGDQMTGLDANPAGSGDNQGFAVFGRVVYGEAAVRAILAAPTDPNQGQGVMRGQMIAAPVRITTARRVPPSAVPVPMSVPEAPPAPPAPTSPTP